MMTNRQPSGGSEPQSQSQTEAHWLQKSQPPTRTILRCESPSGSFKRGRAGSPSLESKLRVALVEAIQRKGTACDVSLADGPRARSLKDSVQSGFLKEKIWPEDSSEARARFQSDPLEAPAAVSLRALSEGRRRHGWPPLPEAAGNGWSPTHHERTLVRAASQAVDAAARCDISGARQPTAERFGQFLHITSDRSRIESVQERTIMLSMSSPQALSSARLGQAASLNPQASRGMPAVVTQLPVADVSSRSNLSGLVQAGSGDLQGEGQVEQFGMQAEEEHSGSTVSNEETVQLEASSPQQPQAPSRTPSEAPAVGNIKGKRRASEGIGFSRQEQGTGRAGVDEGATGLRVTRSKVGQVEPPAVTHVLTAEQQQQVLLMFQQQRGAQCADLAAWSHTLAAREHRLDLQLKQQQHGIGQWGNDSEIALLPLYRQQPSSSQESPAVQGAGGIVTSLKPVGGSEDEIMLQGAVHMRSCQCSGNHDACENIAGIARLRDACGPQGEAEQQGRICNERRQQCGVVPVEERQPQRQQQQHRWQRVGEEQGSLLGNLLSKSRLPLAVDTAAVGMQQNTSIKDCTERHETSGQGGSAEHLLCQWVPQWRDTTTASQTALMPASGSSTMRNEGMNADGATTVNQDGITGSLSVAADLDVYSRTRTVNSAWGISCITSTRAEPPSKPVSEARHHCLEGIWVAQQQLHDQLKRPMWTPQEALRRSRSQSQSQAGRFHAPANGTAFAAAFLSGPGGSSACGGGTSAAAASAGVLPRASTGAGGVPRDLRLSGETMNRMGMAARPLSMMEVRTLTLALAEAVTASQSDAVSILLRELQAAACESGNAVQRIAFFFVQAFVARLAGTGMQKYIQSGVPDDPMEFEEAWMHYTSTTPLSHYFMCTVHTTILHALRQASKHLPVVGRRRPLERLHIIDINIEAMHLWLGLMRRLAGRPQGPPHSVRITVVDIQAPSTPKEAVQARQALGMQVKEQLGVQAVIAGIHEFECDIITCYADELAAGLAQVQVDVGARKRRHEMMQRAREGEGVEALTPFQPGMGSWEDARGGTGMAGGAPHAEGVGTYHGGYPAGGMASVDVLVVTAILALHVYSDEGRHRQSLRNRMLAWFHILYPDVLCINEYNMDAGGPFLVPRTRECFDYNATFLHADDILCSQGEELNTGLRPNVNPPTSNQGNNVAGATIRIMDADEMVKVEQGGDDKCNYKDATAALRVGMPELRLRASISDEGIKPPSFRNRLNRRYTHMIERFLFMRLVINVVALEGDQRFIRPRSHQHWVQVLQSQGFGVAPMLPAVGQQLYCSMANLPDSYGIRVTTDCVSLTVCGRDILAMSLWVSN